MRRHRNPDRVGEGISVVELALIGGAIYAAYYLWQEISPALSAAGSALATGASAVASGASYVGTSAANLLAPGSALSSIGASTQPVFTMPDGSTIPTSSVTLTQASNGANFTYEGETFNVDSSNTTDTGWTATAVD